MSPPTMRDLLECASFRMGIESAPEGRGKGCGMAAELDEVLAERAMKNVTAQAEMASLRITEAVPGRVAFAIDVPATAANYHGSVHGGFLATLLEVAAGMVATTLDMNNVALTSAVNFIKRAPVGPLAVRGEATHVGRSTMVTRCRVETCEGKLLTEATFTLFVLPPEE